MAATNRPAPTEPRPRDPEERPGSGGWLVAFVAAALLGLGIIPILVGRQITEVESEVAEVLEPALRYSARLSTLEARQMARFQAYLLTGRAEYAEAYRGLQGVRSATYDSLRVVAERMNLDIRSELATLTTLSTGWHLGHDDVLRADSARRQALENLPAEQGRYDSILSAARDLDGALAFAIAEGRGRVERARSVQLSITILLVALAFGGTLALAGLAYRLRSALSELERRRAAALGHRRELEAVLEATGDGVLGMDLDGRCTRLNGQGAALLGFTELEAQGRNVHDLVHGRDAEHRRDACPILEALQRETDEVNRDDRLRRRDGSHFPARWVLRPLVDGRKEKGAVLTFTDMTQVREAREALEKAVRARDQVVAVVSHDLRNPLGTVTAAAELLETIPLDEEKRTQQLEVIQRAARRMRRLIEDLLDVARIEGGGLSVEPAPSRPEDLVEEVRALHAPLARDAGVALEVDVPSGCPSVLADHDRTIQVLSNLVGNALKFTPSGGRITLGAEPAPAGVVFSVADTGEGIGEEDRARLFDRFWQVNRTDRSGAGLGLTIVKGIVEAHRGEVWAESEPGQGSTFFVRLPADDGGGDGGVDGGTAGTDGADGAEEAGGAPPAGGPEPGGAPGPGDGARAPAAITPARDGAGRDEGAGGSGRED